MESAFAYATDGDGRDIMFNLPFYGDKMITDKLELSQIRKSDVDTILGSDIFLSIGDPRQRHSQHFAEISLSATKIAQDTILLENSILKYHMPYKSDLIYFPLYVRIAPPKSIRSRDALRLKFYFEKYMFVLRKK